MSARAGSPYTGILRARVGNRSLVLRRPHDEGEKLPHVWAARVERGHGPRRIASMLVGNKGHDGPARRGWMAPSNRARVGAPTPQGCAAMKATTPSMSP